MGSTSNRTKTWLWGWANGSVPASVVDRIKEVRAFGLAEGIDELTLESLQDDDSLGWALSAVAGRIIGAEGAYRCPSDNGFLYVVYTALRFAEDRDGEPKRKTIECAEHGKAFQTFICEHLLSRPDQEWFQAPEDDNPWPDAWCAECNIAFVEQGVWKDENPAKIALICHRCYESKRH